MVYAGTDVHRKRSQVAVVNESGSEILNRNVDNGSEALIDILEDLEPGTPVAFEATYGWGWLMDLLEEHEVEGHLVNPAVCKAIASARLKNDKVDARMLAHLLRTNLLPEAWIAPKEVRDLRALLRHRASLVRMRTALIPDTRGPGRRGVQGRGGSAVEPSWPDMACGPEPSSDAPESGGRLHGDVGGAGRPH
jgi:transposase